jgi:large subunit ribosomal protein L1
MAKQSKRAKQIREHVEPGKVYGAEDAFRLLKEVSKVRFVENVDVAVNLGVDPR